MKIVSRYKAVGLLAMTVGVLSGCAESATEPASVEPAVLLSVVPAGGSVNVDVGTTVAVAFDHAIADGMEEYAALLEGSVTGPEVAGTWSMAQDHMALMFAPTSALKPATTYVIHIGGGMMDEDGDTVNLGMHGVGMGGEWATQSMMTAGMGMGMGGQTGWHMGTGWADPDNGTYGMTFTFTTAG